MEPRSILVIAAAAAALSTAAVAQGTSKGFSRAYIDCRSRAHDSTVQLGLCAQAEMVSQDARLNKAYQQVMRQLASDPAGRRSLQDEERSWLSRRDYECQVDRQTVDTSCLARTTAARADALEDRVRF